MTVPAPQTRQRHPVWLPMTRMSAYLESPSVIGTASGTTLYDEEGRPFVSANAALWNVALGYDDPHLHRAITEQLAALPYSTLFRFAHRPALDLAQRLIDLAPTPGLSSVVYATSGGSAVDTSIRLARRYHRLIGHPERTVVAHFADSYHGTIGAGLAVTGEDLDQDEYLVDRRHVLRLPTPEDAERARAALALLDGVGERLAALVAEPILGSAGVVDVHPDFWSGLARRTGAGGPLFIADEVATGAGRTGTFFACEWLPVRPDLLITSKALNNGYLPLAAVLVHERVAAAFDGAGVSFASGESQAGNPLACAAAIATLDILMQEGTRRDAELLATQLRDHLLLLASESGGQVTAITGRGLMIGVHLVGPPSLDMVNIVCERFRSLGVIVHASPRGFSLFPPYRMASDELRVLLQALETVVGELDLA